MKHLIDKNKPFGISSTWYTGGNPSIIDDEIMWTSNPVDIRIENAWSEEKGYNS